MICNIRKLKRNNVFLKFFYIFLKINVFKSILLGNNRLETPAVAVVLKLLSPDSSTVYSNMYPEVRVPRSV